jgi:hypothetical protein
MQKWRIEVDGVIKATEVAVAPVQGTNEEGWILLWRGVFGLLLLQLS